MPMKEAQRPYSDKRIVTTIQNVQNITLICSSLFSSQKNKIGGLGRLVRITLSMFI